MGSLEPIHLKIEIGLLVRSGAPTEVCCGSGIDIDECDSRVFHGRAAEEGVDL